MNYVLRFALTSALLLLLYPTHYAVAQEVFDDCTSNPDNNATVVIPTDASVDIGTGYSLEVGDEVGVFTEDGDCAGMGVWNGQNKSIAVAGEDTDNGINGFAPGEPLQFRVSHQAADDILTAEIAYKSCSDAATLCRDDGLYESDALYSLEANVIPVELIAFRATQDGTAAQLEWTTASETNNSGFEIHHQKPQDKTWSILGFVDGHGTTLETQNYTYRIEDLAPGAHQFRLRQVDFDGTSELSPVQELHVALGGTHQISEVNPNPVTERGHFSLFLAEPEHVTVEVFNQLGQQIATLADGIHASNEEHRFDIDAADYASGVYLIRVRTERFSNVLSLVVIR